VGYDDATGVPVSMQSDPIANAVDDELDFSVTGWTIDPPDDRALGEITRARRVWERHPPSRYVWSLVFDCDCTCDGERFDVTVVDGDETVRSDGRRVSLEKLEGVPLTVGDFFRMAADAAKNADVTAEFDGRSGYPKRVTMRDDAPGAVHEVTIRVVRFRPA
jgi:hypothetical protein